MYAAWVRRADLADHASPTSTPAPPVPQVVLPLLLGDLVKKTCNSANPPVCVEDTSRSWVTEEQFYAGLGLVQARPGPLFNFSAYLVSSNCVPERRGRLQHQGEGRVEVGRLAQGWCLLASTCGPWSFVWRKPGQHAVGYSTIGAA